MTVQFNHERLDAYVAARAFVASTVPIIERLPRGTRHVRDQLMRASDSVLLNLCEGAGRSGAREKAHFYEIAAGSGTECAGALDIVAMRGFATVDAVDEARVLLHRTTSMLHALARNWRGRA